jgi:hypothetical protein
LRYCNFLPQPHLHGVPYQQADNMFGIPHPKPPYRKEVAMQIVQQEARAFAGNELTVDMPGPVDAPAPPASEAIRFEVRYKLAEYLGMVGEHIAFLLRHEDAATRRQRTRKPLAVALVAAAAALAFGPGWIKALSIVLACTALACLPFTTRLWVGLLATPVFYIKKWMMPACAFSIDSAGIERTTRRGRLFWPWSEVGSVRRYRHGYLVMGKGGGMPIPLRCMQTQELARFRSWAARRSAPAHSA